MCFQVKGERPLCRFTQRRKEVGQSGSAAYQESDMDQQEPDMRNPCPRFGNPRQKVSQRCHRTGTLHVAHASKVLVQAEAVLFSQLSRLAVLAAKTSAMDASAAAFPPHPDNGTSKFRVMSKYKHMPAPSSQQLCVHSCHLWPTDIARWDTVHTRLINCGAAICRSLLQLGGRSHGGSVWRAPTGLHKYFLYFSWSNVSALRCSWKRELSVFSPAWLDLASKVTTLQNTLFQGRRCRSFGVRPSHNRQGRQCRCGGCTIHSSALVVERSKETDLFPTSSLSIDIHVVPRFLCSLYFLSFSVLFSLSQFLRVSLFSLFC